MKTEELNTYDFTKMVMESAWAIRCRRVNALQESSEITSEQADKLPQTVDDVREALRVLQHNKKVVFDILAEQDSEPADSLILDQKTSG